jgi:hypothetical protein
MSIQKKQAIKSSAEADLSYLTHNFDDRFSEVLEAIKTAHACPKFFPGGVTKIAFTIKAGTAELDFEISGPGGGTQITESKGLFVTKRLSGVAWCSEYPDKRSTSDLTATFRTGVDDFILAMTTAQARVSIGSTLRPVQRAHLMHYSWKVAKKQIKAADVPSMDGVDIEWVHPSDEASVRAANDMVVGYGIVKEPALNSRHTEGRAIDMTITWSGTLKIKKADGSILEISTTPRTGENTELIEVGRGYKVIKATFAGDPPHWSDDGH